MTQTAVSLTPGKRVLFLTKDPDLIRRQLSGELDLRMLDLGVEDLLVWSSSADLLRDQSPA